MTESKSILARLKDFERKSPKVMRKFEPPKDDKPELSVSQSEVEEKLKLMKQKRLSRLNMHVDGQTMISEIRKLNQSPDGGETDEAAVTIRNREVPKTDHHAEDTRSSPDRRIPPGSPKKSSSAKRFINKFSCLNEELRSSSEELDNDAYGTSMRKSLPNKQDVGKMRQLAVSRSSANISEEESFVRNSLQRHSDRYSKPSNSRSSSQDINDMISREVAKNTMSNDEYMQRSITYETFGKATTPTTTPKLPRFGEANLLDSESVEGKAKRSEEPTELTEKVIMSDEDDLRTKDAEKKIGDPKSEHTSPGSIGEREHTDSDPSAVRVTSLDIEPNIYENVEFNSIIKKFSSSEMKVPSKNPIPVPRKPTKDERILKRFQENLSTLRDVVKNESEVDFDEIEGFKHALEETTEIVGQYKSALDTVEVKFVPLEKLRRIRLQIEEIYEKVKRFKGLKRDMAYLELSNTLSTNFFKVNNISISSAEGRKEKAQLLDDINSCIRVLEERVSKNEAMLLKILEEQVHMIQTKRIVPTLV